MSKQFTQIKAFATRNGLPIIPIQPSDLSLIYEPRLFYKHIIDGIKESKRRLAISALYLGTGSKEDAIVQAIFDSIQRNSNVNVNIVLDSNRARRVDEKGQSSVSALHKILTFDSVNLNLVNSFKSNQLINRFLSRFQKWNEISSTYHAKLLVFDDDLIITGANLSSAYFENRQDRYMLLKRSKFMANYITELLERVSEQRDSMRNTIEQLNNKYVRLVEKEHDTGEKDTYILPLIQHGPSKVTNIEDFLKFLDSILPKEAKVYLSSGYFNPSSILSDLKIDSVLAPSENANGFYQGDGVLKYIPQLYSSLRKQYIDNHNQCNLFLYDRPGWSFHAKGLWVEELDNLYIHLIGSTNFNCRSSERDFETQLAIFTSNKDLILKLKSERKHLWSDSTHKDKSKNSNLIYHTLARLLKSFL